VDEAVGEGADALGMAGGDGSLAVVAAAASVHDLPFICVPAGTRNHFALDVGVDRHDVVGALDAFTDGVERRIEVNGRAFLNNVSLGIYGEAVRQSAFRDVKVRTLVQTAEQMLGRVGGRRRCAWSTTKGASAPVSPSCWCRTTRTPWVGRSSAGDPRSAVVASASCSSTRRTVETSLRVGPGPHLTSTSSPRLPCTRASTARQ